MRVTGDPFLSGLVVVDSCRELRSNRTKSVNGSGSPDLSLVAMVVAVVNFSLRETVDCRRCWRAPDWPKLSSMSTC